MDNNSNNTNNGVIDMFSTRLRTYLIPLIFGYFLIKLFFATFGVYPKKYYNQTMTINSNDENADKESVLNAYVPGLWNSELTDFLVIIITKGAKYDHGGASRRSSGSSECSCGSSQGKTYCGGNHRPDNHPDSFGDHRRRSSLSSTRRSSEYHFDPCKYRLDDFP